MAYLTDNGNGSARLYRYPTLADVVLLLLK
jgi:hypothetical protein